MSFNSKILFWLVTIFGVFNLVDLITAMFILPGESNPIFLLTNSKFSLILLKLFVIGIVYYIYFKNKYPSRTWLFSYIYIIIIGILGLGFGIYSNVLGILNPQILASASSLTVVQKTNYYFTIVGLFMILPYTISIITFKIYDVIEKKIKYGK
jgi:hypothetical protein